MLDMPEAENRGGAWIWLGIFGVLFILSNDFWAWGSDKPILVGLPWWIWYFFGLNLLLVVAMIVFVKVFWKNENG